jgi:hypothetical protein
VVKQEGADMVVVKKEDDSDVDLPNIKDIINEVKWAAARSRCRKGIEFSCVAYKLCEGAECAFPQVHLAILSLALFAHIGRHRCTELRCQES